MIFGWDEAKRQRTLAERDLDFADAAEVFTRRLVENIDRRFDYGEERRITVGYLRGRMIVVVWTWRGTARHIISMRKANPREQRRYERQHDQA